MPFNFKQFSINDDRSTMKVGTDAVLLGAWVDINNAKSILDIGTGCGVIALMLAQRSSAMIHAVEPDLNSAKQAGENFQNSPWKDKLKVFNTSIQNFDAGNYDLIVSNPPFFSKSLLPPDPKRQAARHTGTLVPEDLFRYVKDARLAVILPTVEGDQFRERAFAFGFHCVRQLSFYSREGKPQERWLMEFSRTPSPIIRENLTLYQEKDRWSIQYAALVRDFLTKVYP